MRSLGQAGNFSFRILGTAELARKSNRNLSLNDGTAARLAPTASNPIPQRRRERGMLLFRQMKSLQKFASVHTSISNRFNLERPSSKGKHSRLAVLPPWPGGSCSPARSATSGVCCAKWRAAFIRLTAPFDEYPARGDQQRLQL